MDSQFEGTHLSSRSAPYPMPPLTYENNRMLGIAIRTSQDVLGELVPEPLVANSDGQMIIYIGDLNVASPVRFGYLEAGIMIPASDGREEGVYMPVLYLDKALPIVVGREVWGYPKYQADLSLKEEAGVVRARVISEGITLIDAELLPCGRITTGIRTHQRGTSMWCWFAEKIRQRRSSFRRSSMRIRIPLFWTSYESIKFLSKE
jgi:hypothetical protein